ncbi:MAG: hemerythrin domain-containing protein, partial [Chloroflexi bacterium]|nr:hemerythrin domain-containing protein [Chloroflexota bacterium]
EWEEDNVYPEVGKLLRRYGNPTATMEVDHEAIVQRIDQFRNDVAAFLSMSGRPGEQAPLTHQLVKNAWQLDAILSLHFRKEEEAYLPLVDSHLTEKEVEKLLGGEH